MVCEVRLEGWTNRHLFIVTQQILTECSLCARCLSRHWEAGMPALVELTLYWQTMKVQRNQLGTTVITPGKNGEHQT